MGGWRDLSESVCERVWVSVRERKVDTGWVVALWLTV